MILGGHTGNMPRAKRHHHTHAHRHVYGGGGGWVAPLQAAQFAGSPQADTQSDGTDSGAGGNSSDSAGDSGT